MVQDHDCGCEVAQQQGVRKPGLISPYQKYWYNRGVQGSVFVHLTWYCPDFNPRGSSDVWNIGNITVVMQFGDIPGEPRRTHQGNSSRQQLIVHCATEMQSVPPPHECCCYFYFFLINTVFVHLDDISHSKNGGEEGMCHPHPRSQAHNSGELLIKPQPHYPAMKDFCHQFPQSGHNPEINLT